MKSPRFRIRSLMIGIAFFALFLALMVQTILLQRSLVREQLLRAEANAQRASAELASQRVRAFLEQSPK